MDQSTLVLAFGLNQEIPEGKTAAWGARLIFPDDLLQDRQSFAGLSTPAGQVLFKWLNGKTSSTGGALRKALRAAAQMAKKYVITNNGFETVTLFEDATGIIKANPNGSYGYLYCVAYLKEEPVA